MKLRKSIWFIILLSVISMSLSMENAYGFSFDSPVVNKGQVLKKSTKEESNSPFSFFFEEENVNESEDDSLLDIPSFWVNNQTDLFKSIQKKVQFSIPRKFRYFQNYSQPLFIVFRNLRL